MPKLKFTGYELIYPAGGNRFRIGLFAANDPFKEFSLPYERGTCIYDMVNDSALVNWVSKNQYPNGSYQAKQRYGSVDISYRIQSGYRKIWLYWSFFFPTSKKTSGGYIYGYKGDTSYDGIREGFLCYLMYNISNGYFYNVWVDKNTGLINPTMTSYVGLPTGGGTWTDLTEFATALKNASAQYEIEIDDPNGPPDESQEGGGEGSRNDDSDIVGIPDLPAFSYNKTGFITIYNPNFTELKNIANYMWSDAFSLDSVKKILANPIDAFISLTMLPVDIPSSAKQYVTVGGLSTGVLCSVADNQYVAFNCGDVTIEEYWGSFLDYDPFTKCSIYLPYIGNKEISADEIMGRMLSLRYHIDILTGTCVAYLISKDGDIRYQFSGQMAQVIPVTGNDFSNLISNIMGAVSTASSAIVSGGESISASAVVEGLMSTANNALNSKPRIQKSGNLSSVSGYLSAQQAYITIERPIVSEPTYYDNMVGFPSNIADLVRNFAGYTKFESIHLENIAALSEELDEIEYIMKSGVLL